MNRLPPARGWSSPFKHGAEGYDNPVRYCPLVSTAFCSFQPLFVSLQTCVRVCQVAFVDYRCGESARCVVTLSVFKCWCVCVFIWECFLCIPGCKNVVNFTFFPWTCVGVYSWKRIIFSSIIESLHNEAAHWEKSIKKEFKLIQMLPNWPIQM